jgi:hypothetical protein
MDLTFRGLGPWGPGKGANLQASEVDTNFWSIATEILNLQNNPALPNGIASIEVSGTQMTITLANGDVMGPFTIPLLTFRWRDEWQPNAPYAELDVFKVTNLGIYLVEFPHTSGVNFDPDIQVGGVAALTQLFGSADASLGSLPDVSLSNLQQFDALIWFPSDEKWENYPLGGMAFQDNANVFITGGYIGGMRSPINPADVATKAYVDGAVTGGAEIPPATLLANIGPLPEPAVPETLSDIFDATLGSTITGNLIFRGGAGWQVLPPGPG